MNVVAPAFDPTDPRRLERFIESIGPTSRAPTAAAEPRVDLVCFRLDEPENRDNLFALSIAHVREVVRVNELVRVPHAPEHVRGVQSLRGVILPVLEVKTRLGLQPAIVTAASRVLVVEARGRLLGLLVDGVERVISTGLSTLTRPPADVVSRLSAHVMALAHLPIGMALLLDLEKLLHLPDAQQPSPKVDSL